MSGNKEIVFKILKSMRPGRSLSCLVVVDFIVKLNIIICSTTTTPDIGPVSDATVTTPEPICRSDTCLNNGTCRELDDWECSNNPDMLPSVCVCSESFTGARCEFSIRCGGARCKDNEQCTLDRCIVTSAESPAPVCKKGVHPVTYQLDIHDRRKPIVCLDMYYTTNYSYCYDNDDSIEFEIVEEEELNLFCLNIDYRQWQTCLHVNGTFNEGNFPLKPILNVTLQAREYNMNPQHDSIVFSVTFNEAPDVTTPRRVYMLNVAEDVSPYTISVEQAFNVTDHNALTYTYKGNRPGISIDRVKGQLMFDFQVGIISIDIEIKDDGIPSLETLVNVQIEVVRLSCGIDSPLYANYRNMKGIVGKLKCDTSDGFEISDLRTSYTVTGDLELEITPNGFLRLINGSLGNHNVSTTITLVRESGEATVYVDFSILIAYIRTAVFSLSKKTWIPAYGVQSSSDFSALRSEVTQEIKDELNKLPDLMVNVELFSEGSVYVHFTLFLRNEENSTYATQQLNASIANNGTVGTLEVNRTSFISRKQVGLALISSMVYSSPGVHANTPEYTRNNTHVQLTCTGTFVQPVGDVTMEWRMTSNNALVVPLAYSRLQTNLTSPSTGVYRGTLTASNILFRDTGPFTCIIKDERGRSDNKTIRVTVVARPVVRLLPLKNVYITSGSMINITCNVTESGTDDTNITFYKNGNPIQTEKSMSSNFSVTGNIESNGNYTCRGKNGVGEGDDSAITSVSIIKQDIIRCGNEATWQTTKAGLTIEAPCPDEQTGEMSRTCSVDGSWLEVNKSQCVSPKIEKVLADIAWIEDGVQVANISTVAETLSANTKPKDLGSKEIGLVSQSLDRLLNISKESNITENKNETKQFTKGFVTSASNILDPKTVDKWENLKESSTTPTTVLELVDNVTEVAANSLDEGEVETITSPNIDLQVGKTSPNSIQDIVFPEQKALKDTSKITSSLRLSSETLKTANGTVRFSAIYYKNISSLLPEGTELKEPSEDGLGQNSSSKLVVSGDVFAFNLFPPPEKELYPPLKMNFTHTNQSLDSARGQCVFLNISESNWQIDGCNASIRARNYTECSCNHLTTFALLMSPRRTGVKPTPLPLTIITKVGCSISVACLVLTVILYATVWRYVKSNQSVIVVHICVCLSIAMLLFMFGVEQTKYKAVCTSIAVALHFFYIASFFMMLAAGLEALWSIVLVFAVRSKLKPLLTGAWVMAVVIVTVSMAATQLHGYGTPEHCWLSMEDNLRWAFIGPVLLIVIVNFIIMGKLIHTMLSTRALQNVDVKNKIKRSLRGICILIPVLGVSWIFGVISVEDEERVMEYIFAIINSLQGLFIFITQCVMKRKVRIGFANYRRRFLSSRSQLSSQPRRKSRQQDRAEGSRDLASQQNLLPFHSISEDPQFGASSNPAFDKEHAGRDAYVTEQSGAYDNNIPDQPPPRIFPPERTSGHLPSPTTPASQGIDQSAASMVNKANEWTGPIDDVNPYADEWEGPVGDVNQYADEWASHVGDVDLPRTALVVPSVDVGTRIGEWFDQFENADGLNVDGNRRDGIPNVTRADIHHEMNDYTNGADLPVNDHMGRVHDDRRMAQRIAAVDPSLMNPHIGRGRTGNSPGRIDGHGERSTQQPAAMKVSDWLASDHISPGQSSSQLHTGALGRHDVSSLMEFVPYGVRANTSIGGGHRDSPFLHPGMTGYTSHERMNTLQDRPFSQSMESFNSLI
ncbi:uncharacterized protein LOC124149084 isoform X1 [Haliotis rufescens]|uniref:uncharacterized protein LOC124149084 isoform X1 n=2 Tax=Haliotis rufescens TaxID=6454 RepID=UPI00201E9F8C|nr:uncharacterized protein LOC124149084 isoform X1 [Haliotis rufescens]